MTMEIDFSGLTKEQVFEIQSFIDTKLDKFRKENERMRKYLSVKDPDKAFKVLVENATVALSRAAVWKAAIEWCNEQVLPGETV